MSKQPLSDPVAEEAIGWLVQIQSGEFCAAQQQALDAWRATSAHHQRVYEQLIAGLDQLKASPWRGRSSAQLLRSLEQPNSRRSFLRTSLCAVGLAAGVGWVSRFEDPGQTYATGTAQRRTWQLADGSLLNLNARSQVLSRFAEEQRSLELRAGEILVNVAANTLHPLQLNTRAGRITAITGRLLLSEQGSAVRLVTLDGYALLRLEGGAEQRVESHQSTLFDHQRILVQGPMLPTETAWLDGWLVVRNQTLASVVEAIRPYRDGIVRLDPTVAGLRVSGRFPLDDSRQTLEALEQSLPIRVTQWGGLLLLIGARVS
ncbi:FecR family protein [Pseudomonas sp.]|uniref:FecR family protein n=1 Tax=Pseudomonas sp. TaxID=306 RepID=UPI002633AF32|nr:FecR family protein [Pseudomonas sp.]